jgi:hypothetical protein
VEVSGDCPVCGGGGCRWCQGHGSIPTADEIRAEREERRDEIRESLPIGPGMTGLDEAVAELVWAMNRLPGIETTNSCSGHGKQPFRIWFNVTDYQARGLLVLSRLLSHNYHAFWESFEVLLGHQDVDPQVCWLLESKWYTDDDTTKVQKIADELAYKVNALVDDAVDHYNILYNRSRR